MKNAPGCAPLPARSASIKDRLEEPSALEAARTQGVPHVFFEFYQRNRDLQIERLLF
jgi:hypothetical protein